MRHIRLDIQKLRSFRPCYDPRRVLSPNWSGTLYQLLGNEKIPAEDRVWVATRPGLLDDKTLRLFAVACAKRVRRFVADKKTFDNTLRVVTRYANGKATVEELAEAQRAAEVAAATTAATTAADVTAYYAAYAAAYAAAEVAAEVAAAAYAAAVAAEAAAFAAADAAAEERQAQVELLRSYLRTGSFTQRKK